MICDDCPSFQGRNAYGIYCKTGLLIRDGDMRTCEDFGRTNQKEFLIKRGVWDKVKKYWKLKEK